MSTRIRYTPGELASFQLVPETCAVIEDAMDEAFACPNFTIEELQAVMSKYRTEDPDQLRHAIFEIIQRFLFPRKRKLDKVVKYQGTFPLRLALVRMVEEKHSFDGSHCNYQGWMDMELKTGIYAPEKA